MAKTIEDLSDELSNLFGGLIGNMTPSELNTMMAFLLTTFSDDFPVIKSRVYKLSNLDTTNGQYKIYLNDIDEDFLELKYLFPIKPQTPLLYSVMQQNQWVNGFLELEETFTIQFASQYVQSMSSYYVPRKPIIFNDSTNGSYVTIDRDSVVILQCERAIDPHFINEHVYSVLRTYSNYKFVDFILNRSFGDTMDMNRQIFELMYDNIQSDMTSSGGSEGISSVSLGGLSVSFDNKLQSYSDTLSSLAAQTNNPIFVQEMNKLRKEYYKKFKRKKNVFYNFMF